MSNIPTVRATKVAWVSVTVSSIEMPVPSLRISTPKILAPAMAPYPFAAFKGDIEGKYLIAEPRCCQLSPGTDSGNSCSIKLVDSSTDKRTGIPNDRTVEQSSREDLWTLELRPDLVLVGDELSAGLIEQVEQSMTIEVDPYQRACNPTFIPRVGPWIGGSHGVDALAGDWRECILIRVTASWPA